MQRLVLVLLCVLLIVCGIGNLRAESAVLFRAALMTAALVPLYAAARSAGRGTRYPYVLSCMLAALLYFAQASSSRASDAAFWFFAALNLLSPILLFAWLTRPASGGENQNPGGAALGETDAWIIRIGFLWGVGMFLKEFLGAEKTAWALSRAIAAALSVIHLAVLSAAGARLFRVPSMAKNFSAALLGVLIVMLVAGAGRYAAIQVFLDRAAKNENAGNIPEARRWMNKAIGAHAALKSKSLAGPIALADSRISMREGRHRAALENFLRHMREHCEPRFPRKGERLAIGEYFQPAPIAPVLDRRGHPETYSFFAELHLFLDQTPDWTETLHRLFLWNGYLDRLEERYATAGFPSIQDPNAFLEALEQCRVKNPDKEAEALYLKGALLCQWGRHNAARAAFEAVLAERPAHANAIVFLERLERRRRNQQALETWNQTTRVLEYDEMQGSQRAKYQLQSVFWQAFEANPGRYEIALEFRAEPALGIWPHLEIFLGEDPAPIFSGSIESEDWTTVRIEARFDREERRRLLLLFTNDFYRKGVDKDTTEDRNLAFRKAEIRYFP